MWGSEHYGYKRGSNAVEAKYSAVKDANVAAVSEQLIFATSEVAAAESRARDAAKRGSTYAQSLALSLEGFRNEKLIPADCIGTAGRLRLSESVRIINAYADPQATVAVSLSGKLPTVAGTKRKFE
jgi:hypothetical protein